MLHKDKKIMIAYTNSLLVIFPKEYNEIIAFLIDQRIKFLVQYPRSINTITLIKRIFLAFDI